MTTGVPAQLAGIVTLRAGRRCEYCHAPQIVIGQAFHLEHILPRSAGGQTSAENLCLACSHCNFAKGSRTSAIDLRTGRRLRLFNPRIDNWEVHFRWSSDWTKLMGRTPVGRATVSRLDMNDELLREARVYWRLAGRIP